MRYIRRINEVWGKKGRLEDVRQWNKIIKSKKKKKTRRIKNILEDWRIRENEEKEVKKTREDEGRIRPEQKT